MGGYESVTCHYLSPKDELVPAVMLAYKWLAANGRSTGKAGCKQVARVGVSLGYSCPRIEHTPFANSVLGAEETNEEVACFFLVHCPRVTPGVVADE
jgi:hypothetical protein